MTSDRKAMRTIHSSRSRTGCAFCKQKRLKCDETKPACRNCITRNRECPGYRPTYRWKSEGQTVARASGSTPVQKKFVQVALTAVERGDQENASNICPNTNLINESNSMVIEKMKKTPTAKSRPQSHPNVSDTAESTHNFVDLDGLTIECLMTESQGVVTNRGTLAAGCSWVRHAADMEKSGLTIGFTDADSKSTRTFACGSRQNARDLLTEFYATSPKLTYPLSHDPTKLIGHYFSVVCGLYSCFDSFLNPFRCTVSQGWDKSASTYYAIQSMAAAHLANELPYMRNEGMQLHRKAAEHLSLEISSWDLGRSGNHQPLLSLLLLGLSACWSWSGELGLTYLRTARSFLDSNVRAPGKETSSSSSILHFFEEAMVYWEMVNSFVAGQDHIALSQSPPILQDSGAVARISDRRAHFNNEVYQTEISCELLPHPWTGISPESQILLGQTGRLIRIVRTQPCSFNDLNQLLFQGLDLEERLLSMSVPDSSAISECGDASMLNDDFVLLAEITRDASLLELYRAFPALLTRRWPKRPPMDLDGGTSNALPYDIEEADLWLIRFAIHILQRLETIPFSSNIRCHQLLLLVIAASELQARTYNYIDQGRTTDLMQQVHEARKFVSARLLQLSRQLPTQPVHVTSNIIAEVWRRLDDCSNRDDVFWMDIMVEKGWHTIIG